MTEKEVQNNIRIALSKYAVVFRANVGLFYTKYGQPIRTGLPNGFSDLFGFRRLDGKIFFIEVKGKNGRVRKDQKKFIESVTKLGALAGVAYSVDDALKIIEVD